MAFIVVEIFVSVTHLAPAHPRTHWTIIYYHNFQQGEISSLRRNIKTLRRKVLESKKERLRI